FLMFLFGVLEYCRYLLVLHTTTNAARDGARYASVRAANQPTQWTVSQTTDTDFGTLPVFEITSSTDGNGDQDDGTHGVTQYVKDDSRPYTMMSNYKVRVSPCAPAALYGTAANNYPPTFQPKPAPSSGSAIWNSITFSERLAVRVTGTYKPILPSFLWMGNS